MTVKSYFDQVDSVLNYLRRTQQAAIERAAEWITESLLQGGMLHIFGAAHSSLIAAEMFYRAGGLIPVNPINDSNLNLFQAPLSKGTRLERLQEYGAIVLDAYDVRPGEILILPSQSGKNAATVELALQAQQRGLRLIAVTSLSHSRSVPAGHSSGKKLYEIADLVIDTGTPLGDASVAVSPDLPMVAPLSSVAGMIVVNAMVAQVAANYAARGQRPPTWVSNNVPQGEAINAKAMQDYASRLKGI
jgi:uncharacterized phosphosugar-binding protein